MSAVADKQKTPAGKSPFPPDKFQTFPGVVVFAEHRTRLRDGTPVTYDRAALERIAANCNRRIEETGNYAAVCIGHTDRDPGDKPLVGFAGPFRVEERDGRAVIVADFHIFKDAVEELRRYPRPSPEVWVPKGGFDPDRIFLDPIAMLGAETPRLDLGMTFLYRARDGDLLCEKYAAHPAPASVAFPEFGSQDKVDYAMPSTLTPDDIQAILKAIESTDWYKWVRQQMAATQKPGEHQEPDGDEPPAEDQAKKEPYAKDDQGEPIPDKRNSQPEPEPDDEPAPPQDRPKRVEEYRCTTHYAKREAVLEAQKEIYQLRRELEHERALRVNAERRRILEGLARRYALDLKEEMAVCAYGKMDDAAFERHITRIEKYYRPLPVDQALPVWGEGYAEPEGSKEFYRRKQDEELSARARDYVRKLANQGKWISYEEALDLAQRGKI